MRTVYILLTEIFFKKMQGWGWRDGSVGKVLAIASTNADLNLYSSTEWVETEESWGLASHIQQPIKMCHQHGGKNPIKLNYPFNMGSSNTLFLFFEILVTEITPY